MPGLSVCGAIRDGQWRGASGAALTPERNAAIADWRTHERRLVVNALKTPVNPINASHYRYHNMSHHARFSVGGAPQAQRENARWLLMARRRVVGSDRFARRADQERPRSEAPRAYVFRDALRVARDFFFRRRCGKSIRQTFASRANARAYKRSLPL
jgi:hypothetical protein